MGEAVGFVGLGEQGAPIARRVAAVFPTAVWARRPEQCADVPTAEAVVSLEELGRRCSVVSLCVRSDDDVRRVVEVLGPAMAVGGIIVVHSTVAPRTVVDLAVSLAKRRVTLVDAPVSGGPDRAERGDMVVLAGCDAATFERVRPIFDSFGSLVEHLGPVGAGQMMKLVNNGLFFANATAGASAMLLARELGLDATAAGRVLGAGTGRSTAFDILDIGGGGLDRLAGSDLVEKDIGHLAEVARNASAPAQLVVNAAGRLFEFTKLPEL